MQVAPDDILNYYYGHTRIVDQWTRRVAPISQSRDMVIRTTDGGAHPWDTSGSNVNFIKCCVSDQGLPLPPLEATQFWPSNRSKGQKEQSMQWNTAWSTFLTQLNKPLKSWLYTTVIAILKFRNLATRDMSSLCPSYSYGRALKFSFESTLQKTVHITTICMKPPLSLYNVSLKRCYILLLLTTRE